MIQIDVYTTLSESTVVTDIVSSRIYPGELPQKGIVPAIAYTVPDITPIRSLGGESGLDYATVEITCWAKSYLSAHLLAAAVRAAFAETGTGNVADDLQDTRDEETRNYGVIMSVRVWSESNVNRSATMGQAVFTGDGITTDFPLPSGEKFREGTLLVFFNGRLAKKGVEGDSTAAYWEKTTLDGFVFRTAPQGGDYADEILAFYEKN